MAALKIENLITDHLDLWSAAVRPKSSAGRGSNSKLELTGIKKLRELILELAVCGKLVPNSKSEYVHKAILKEMENEKAAFHLAKGVKLQKFKPIVEEFHLPSFPSNWQEVYFEQVITYITDFQANGSFATLKQNVRHYEESNYALLVRLTDLRHGLSDSSAFKYTDKTSYEFLSKSSIEGGELVVANVGAGVGTTLEIPQINMPATLAPNMFMVVLSKLIFKKYFLLFSQSPIYQKYIQQVNTGTGQPKINKTEYKNCKLPLPPLEEQHRIVAKVDELMALCDQLEQRSESQLAAHQTLVETMLATLTDSGDADELAQNWARLSTHFDTLFTTEASINALKQTILQLAVMGKLVPQDPSDEPAAKLLTRITKEKNQLIKEGKIKKLPTVEPIGDAGVLPITWQQIVVQDFADIRLGSTPSRAEPSFWCGDIPWVSSGEVAGNVIEDTNEKITKLGFERSSTSLVPKRSLLMAIIGQGKTRGQTALLGIDACTNQNVASFVFNEELVVPEFVWVWAQSKYEAHRGDGRGGAQPALNGKIVRSFRFPLPPFKEQHRIVAKVDRLIALCDQLKACLSYAQTIQVHLAETIVEKTIQSCD